ncbi:mannosyl-oligosaccharide 1,2-alpha-mannosidase IA-like [Amphibalanus amphitrite]|uniref:mannosyl-oligosaccharide 1,2-alpha-mannosidase IA-like n=1 Tax=Amphibalanus amphitrite TaxID=1232801 RepID=UPI001C9171C2|nr:mannosyl-oligosaccharide 1,2-alpha-mannosidase IA-like [Amphibalanus amphitrite]
MKIEAAGAILPRFIKRSVSSSPPRSRCKCRERNLLLLVVGTFALICFGTIFYLPDLGEGLWRLERLKRVQKRVGDVGGDLLLPVPPPAPGRPGAAEDRRRLYSKAQEAAAPASGGSAAPVPPDPLHPVISGGEDPDPVMRFRRRKIKEMMRHAWKGYVTYAWGEDELRPVSRRGRSAGMFGRQAMGATIVDALDTLLIMGLEQEFSEARLWVKQKLDLAHVTSEVSVFEVNIRYVGGLLACFALTGDALFRDKAEEIARALLPAFDTPTGIPYAMVVPATGRAKNFGWASMGGSILSEFGTLHMEFSYLSDVTGQPVFREKVRRVRDQLARMDTPGGLFPNYLHPVTGDWGQHHTSVGALGDSFYEYLLKEWLRSGGDDRQALRMFQLAMGNITDRLVKTSDQSGLTFVAEMHRERLSYKMDHLACFIGGLYALAAAKDPETDTDRYLELGRQITATCHESYDRTATKLGPESFRFTDQVEARPLLQQEKYYILRPEVIESYFVLWRLTGDPKYRDWGWQAAQAIEQFCRVEAGFSGIKDVDSLWPEHDDVQQSFFLAETLKYLYLLFSDSELLSLDQWVFNTEAHPLPIRGANQLYRQTDVG